MADKYEDDVSGQLVVSAIVSAKRFTTLVVGGSTSAPTLGTNTNVYSNSQSGEDLLMSLTLNQTASGSGGSGTYLYPLPAGLSVSTLEVPASHYNSIGLGVVGECEFYDGTQTYEGTVHVYNATNLYVTVGNHITAPAAMGSTTYSMSGATFRLSFKARFLCTEYVGQGTQANGAGRATSLRPGIVGGLNGVAAATGDIGEVVTANLGGAQTSVANTYVDASGTLTLTTGSWEIFANPMLYAKWVSGQTVGHCAIRDSSNVVQKRYAWTPCVTSGSTDVAQNVAFSLPLSVVGSVTLKLSIICNAAAAASFMNIVANNIAPISSGAAATADSFWYAVRRS